jgi:hypothetical protein
MDELLESPKNLMYSRCKYIMYLAMPVNIAVADLVRSSDRFRIVFGRCMILISAWTLAIPVDVIEVFVRRLH